MRKITKFVLNSKQKSLTFIMKEVEDKNPENKKNQSFVLNYEYLRIFSPSECAKVKSNKNPTPIPAVFHKKNISVVTLEPLGKHGYRIGFNDGFSDIYTDSELLELLKNFNVNWELYLAQLSSTNNREESINFKAI